MTAEHEREKVSMPKPAGMVLYKWMASHSLNEDPYWYAQFYRQVVMDNDLFPATLPTHFVLTYYVKYLDAGRIKLRSNKVADHLASMNAWLRAQGDTPFGFYTNRDLLYHKHLGEDDFIDIKVDSKKNFTFLLTEKKYNSKNTHTQITLNL